MPVFHHLPPSACLDALNAAPEGLASDDVRRRLADYGPNRLPEQRARSLLRRFLAQFHMS